MNSAANVYTIVESIDSDACPVPTCGHAGRVLDFLNLIRESDAHRIPPLDGNFLILHHRINSLTFKLSKHGRLFFAYMIRQIIKLCGIHAYVYEYTSMNGPTNIPECLPKMWFVSEPHTI